MATCLLALIHPSVGMSTVYYRNGEVCEVCAEEHGTRSQTYYPSSSSSSSGGNQRVVYRTEERVVSRPSSSSYITNRDDTYSSSNFHL